MAKLDNYISELDRVAKICSGCFKKQNNTTLQWVFMFDISI